MAVCDRIDFESSGKPTERHQVKVDPGSTASLQIVNLETDEECGKGEGGEILVKSRCLVAGYGDAQDEFNVTEDGFFRTGLHFSQ